MALDIPGYRIIKQLGVGAASKIHLAEEVKSGKPFAVKHVLRNSSEDDPFIKQVESEHAICSRIDHPYLRRSHSIHHIRKLLQLKEVVVILEYVDGLPLEKARPNRLKSFLDVFHKVAAGLGALHEAGFVHSDMKPTNIMVARRGVVKIIDFGQSCPMHHRKGRIQGTPDYIAPEQVERHPLDQRTDVYNLGATMYWVLTSEKYPTKIRGTDIRGAMNIISSDKPIAPIEHNDKIPLALSQLVMECCRENPSERPTNMKQVGARLAVVKRLWKKHIETLRGRRGETASVDPPVFEPEENP